MITRQSYYWNMHHAGFYVASVGGQDYYIIRRKRVWWLMYEHDYRRTPITQIGIGNAKPFKTLARVKAHLERLNQFSIVYDQEA